MNVAVALSRRDNDSILNSDDPGAGPPPMANFFVTLVAVFLVSCVFAFVLLCIRRKRRLARQQTILPSHNRQLRSHHQRQLTITTSSNLPPSIRIYEEQRTNLMPKSSESTDSAVPEIRITFPDEAGRMEDKQSPRVVVVRIGEGGSVGMEPLRHEESLPPYQSSDAARFESLDLERIGGLREKESAGQRWS